MIWIRMTPNVPVSKKPAETRMGKGKGATEYYAAVVRPGQVRLVGVLWRRAGVCSRGVRGHTQCKRVLGALRPLRGVGA